MTALLWFIPPDSSALIPAMVVHWLATIGAGLAVVFYNAMLAGLVDRKRIGRWSGWGWALGYAGGLACLILSLLAFVREDAWFALNRDRALHVRATFLLTAGWHALFSIPLFIWTPDEPSRGLSLSDAVREGLKQLSDTLRNLRRYRTVIRFLIARMIYIDGLTTIFAFGGVYAAGTFGMNEQEVLTFGIALNVSAGLGAFVFSWVDDWIGSRRTMLFSLIGIILPGTGMLWTHSNRLFWTLGMLLGIFVGPVQAAARSYLSKIAPAHLRNEMFGLYALSSKATAFVGPLAVGGLIFLTGSQRIGMSVIFVMLAVGAALVWTLPNAEEASAD